MPRKRHFSLWKVGIFYLDIFPNKMSLYIRLRYRNQSTIRREISIMNFMVIRIYTIDSLFFSNLQYVFKIIHTYVTYIFYGKQIVNHTRIKVYYFFSELCSLCFIGSIRPTTDGLLLEFFFYLLSFYIQLLLYSKLFTYTCIFRKFRSTFVCIVELQYLYSLDDRMEDRHCC